MKDKILSQSQKLFNESQLSDFYGTVAEMLEDNYYEETISEIADGMVDIYTYDLKKWAGTPEGQEYTERAIDEFGWDGVGSELTKAYQMGQFIQSEEQLYKEYEAIKDAYQDENDK